MGTEKQREYAADTLAYLALGSDRSEEIKAIMAAGAVQPLVALLRSGTEKQRESAVFALHALSMMDGTEAAIAGGGAISALMALLGTGNGAGTEEARIYAAGTLGNLAFDNATGQMIATSGAIPLLVALAANGTDNERERANYALGVLARVKASIKAQILAYLAAQAQG